MSKIAFVQLQVGKKNKIAFIFLSFWDADISRIAYNQSFGPIVKYTSYKSLRKFHQNYGERATGNPTHLCHGGRKNSNAM